MELILAKKAQQQLDKALARLERSTNELSALIMDFYAPTLWLDFLNADPKDRKAMWPVYRGFTEFIRVLKERHSCSGDLTGTRLLSKSEFLKQYPLELQEDAERLHEGMREVIDSGDPSPIRTLIMEMDQEEPVKLTEKRRREISEAEAAITNGAHIPRVSFTTGIELVEEDGERYQLAQIHTPAANHKNFWLAVIYERFVTASYNDGKITVRLCAAPDCLKYFVPEPRSHNQRYHSKRCRNRHHMQEWRRSPKSSP